VSTGICDGLGLPAIPSRPDPAENSGDVPEADLSEEQRTPLERSEQLAPLDVAGPQEIEQTPNMNNEAEDVLSTKQAKEGNFQADPNNIHYSGLRIASCTDTSNRAPGIWEYLNCFNL
jgi:hypothetical protein